MTTMPEPVEAIQDGPVDVHWDAPNLPRSWEVHGTGAHVADASAAWLAWLEAHDVDPAIVALPIRLDVYEAPADEEHSGRAVEVTLRVYTATAFGTREVRQQTPWVVGDDIVHVKVRRPLPVLGVWEPVGAWVVVLAQNVNARPELRGPFPSLRAAYRAAQDAPRRPGGWWVVEPLLAASSWHVEAPPRVGS